MTLYLADVIPVIVAFQSFCFAFVLLTDQGPKKTSNRYLAAFLLVLGIQFTAILSEPLGFGTQFIQNSVCIYGFAYGPLLYLYTNSLIYKSFHFKPGHLLHSIPVIVLLVVIAMGYSPCNSLGFLIYISLITYVILAILAMAAYRNILRETQSSQARTDLIWLQWTMIIFCITLLLDIFDQLLWSTDIYQGISSIHIGLLLLINWMFYKGLKQPQIFLGISVLDQDVYRDKKNTTIPKVPDSHDKKELAGIQNFMQTQDLHTQAELSLKELAIAMEMSPRRLSYLINAFLGQNFMGFVNHYRIQHAKKRLSNPKDKDETIQEVMFDVGFNSKSSFNTLFKADCSLTPTEYRKKHSTTST
ncbi:helix-turn-helix domain-containing protein [Spongiimicrobium sp. 3-5]|uniref:AraC family transcriptional regulator n=1 Tax=Spongiimicrobium sp. 3-5 TaxID=3332596 RepID=UPI00398083C6